MIMIFHSIFAKKNPMKNHTTFKAILFAGLLVSATNTFAQGNNPNVNSEAGYVVFAPNDTIRGKVSIEFIEKPEPGTMVLKAMNTGTTVSIQPYDLSQATFSKREVICFFVRDTRYEAIRVKDASAFGVMTAAASGVGKKGIFYKNYLDAGDYSFYQDAIDDYNFTIKKKGDDRAYYVKDILKNKKAAKDFLENCEALKEKIKSGADDLKDVKSLADFLSTNCK